MLLCDIHSNIKECLNTVKHFHRWMRPIQASDSIMCVHLSAFSTISIGNHISMHTFDNQSKNLASANRKRSIKLIEHSSKIRHTTSHVEENDVDILIWFTNYSLFTLPTTVMRIISVNVSWMAWHTAEIESRTKKRTTLKNVHIKWENNATESMWQCHNRLSPHFMQQMAIYWKQTLIVFNINSINSADGKKSPRARRTHNHYEKSQKAIPFCQ